VLRLAKKLPTLNATSRTTLARSATIITIKTASRPWTSAKLNKKKEDARLNN